MYSNFLRRRILRFNLPVLQQRQNYMMHMEHFINLSKSRNGQAPYCSSDDLK
jgi:hypothetical protein